jgi:hypothetical protein
MKSMRKPSAVMLVAVSRMMAVMVAEEGWRSKTWAVSDVALEVMVVNMTLAVEVVVNI